MKKVSVIIPTYRRSEYLLRSIKSVLNQTYKNTEIIVVDDNGIGNEFQLINERKLSELINSKKIIYLKHNVNKNGAAARNTGMKIASGEYITFLDDDDFFLENRIEVLVNKLEENRECDGVYSSMIKLKNKQLYNYRQGYREGNLLNDVLCQYSFFGTGSNMFFKKNCIKIIGEFDETFFRYQDLEYMVRFFEKGFNICAVNSVLVVKCEEDSMNVPNYERMKIAKEMYCNKFKRTIEKNNFNHIMYCIYKELYIFSSGNEHREAAKILKRFKRIQFKDKLFYVYNKLVSSNVIFKFLNYKIRKLRCIGKYTKTEKKEINSILRENR